MKGQEIKNKVEKKLNDKELGLQLIPSSSPRDHFMYSIYYKSYKIGILQISYSSSEFGKGLIGKMSRQLGINSNQLKGLVSCNFWGKDYVANSHLIQKLKAN
jgi:hypothetical protein